MNSYAVLVEQAKQGNQDSFAALYEQVADDLYRMALYTLGNVHDAQDVVSETFMEAYRGLGSLRDNSAFKAWIMRILSIRCKRRIGQYVKSRGNLDIDEMSSILEDRNDVMQDSINRSDILAALSTLSASERQIVLLSVLQGYTTREISEILDVPHGTISSKLFRALKKLRKKLEA